MARFAPTPPGTNKPQRLKCSTVLLRCTYMLGTNVPPGVPIIPMLFFTQSSLETVRFAAAISWRLQL